MSKEYDAITAFHYASYRPPLHFEILEKCMGSQSYDSGLDIGCGTGQSSVALSNFCDDVIGIDPSGNMLSKAIVNPKISYKLFDKNRIDFDENLFDVITLAGSLWYGKSQSLLNEIIRVGKRESIVVVYDFEILTNEILQQLGFDTKDDLEGAYNHEEDFSGLDNSKVRMGQKKSEKIHTQISLANLAHLLLSVKSQYEFLAAHSENKELYNSLLDRLSLMTNEPYFKIQANTFSSLYHIT